MPLDYQRTASITLCFPVISLLHQLAFFSFPQSDKWILPRKAEGKEKIDMYSPTCILPPNATNLAFRLFAPLIRMPLRNLCQVSVHSFSLMKHQISFTNNSCHIQTLWSQPARLPSLANVTHLSDVSLRTACHHGTQVKVSTLSASSNLGRQNESVVFKKRHNAESPAFDTGSWNVMLHEYLFE